MRRPSAKRRGARWCGSPPTSARRGRRSWIGACPPRWLRTAAYLEALSQPYALEYLGKDVRYALGLTVPCGTLCIDLQYTIGPKLVATAVVKKRELASALNCARFGG